MLVASIKNDIVVLHYTGAGMTLMHNRLDDYKCNANEVITFKLGKTFLILISVFVHILVLEYFPVCYCMNSLS